MRPSARRLTVMLLVAVAVLCVVALQIGPGDIDLADVLTVLRSKVFGSPTEATKIEVALVWDVQLPRALLAAWVGAALAAAGTVTQGLFRNPMAEPGVLGISMGAATTAVVGFALGLDALGLWVTPTLAILGAGLVLAALFMLARPVGGMTTLLLSGIAIGALCSAVTTLVLAMGTERWDLGLKVVQWLMGSFEGRSWDHLLPAIGPIGLALVLCAWLRLDLDALQLGPETAQSLGVDLIRTRRVAMAAVGILVGVATAMTGVIGFVGLIVPHVARRWVGAGHRALLPVCMALGALVLLAVDVVARAVPDYALPPGAITSLLGAPFFLWLLHHRGLEGV